MSEERINEIEIKIAFQEDLILSLNHVVSDQQNKISRLEETCKLLNDRINNKVDVNGQNQEIEIPPHY